jgi:hypothetical protein
VSTSEFECMVCNSFVDVWPIRKGQRFAMSTHKRSWSLHGKANRVIVGHRKD